MAVKAQKASECVSVSCRLVSWHGIFDAAFIAQWDALAAECVEPNAFSESWFLAPALRHFDVQGRGQIFTLWGGGQLCGLMPLATQPRYGRWWLPHVQNWLHHNAFLGVPLVRVGYEQAFWRSFLDMMDAQPLRGLFAHLRGLPTGGPLAAALGIVAEEQGRHLACVERTSRAFLQSDLCPGDYFEHAVRPKKRKELRRQKNRLSEEGVLTFIRCDSDAGLEVWTQEFLALEMRGWKGANGSALVCADATRNLFIEVLKGAAFASKLERLELRLDGKPLAMLVSFLCSPGSFSFKTAFDEDFARFSPGVLLQIENLALLERPEIDWCDSCAVEGHPMIDSLWTERRGLGRYSVAIGGPARCAIFNRLASAELARTTARAANIGRHEGPSMTVIFDSPARQYFAANYPDTPHKLLHQLRDHPLLELEALAVLGEELPVTSVEYNKGDLPIGIDPASVPANGRSIGDTIRYAASSGSWAVLKNVEHKAEYKAFLMGILAELKPHIECKTGQMFAPQAYIFVSSPNAVTPYHFDPEHNILLQLRGTKTMIQFPAGDARFAPDETHEGYHTGGHRNLVWHDSLADGGTAWPLKPGEAVYVPVMAPHYVRNGSVVSISLSVTWRSEWSFAEADARAFNSLLRKGGVNPKAPGRFPQRNTAKAMAWRVLRKLRVG